MSCPRVRIFFFACLYSFLAYIPVSFYQWASSFYLLFSLFCLVLSRRGFGARCGEKMEVDEYFRTPRSESRPLHNPLAAEFGVYDQHHLDEFILDYLPTFSLVRFVLSPYARLVRVTGRRYKTKTASYFPVNIYYSMACLFCHGVFCLLFLLVFISIHLVSCTFKYTRSTLVYGLSQHCGSPMIILLVGVCWRLLGPVGTCWDLLRPVGTCWDLLRPVGTCWDLLGPVGTCWGLSGPVGEPSSQLLCRTRYFYRNIPPRCIIYACTYTY